MPTSPRVFISATSQDLGSYRDAVREALLAADIQPVLQEHSPAKYGPAVEMLREVIAGCDAVICLVGRVYGHEPLTYYAAHSRRSYAQLEHDIAIELRKPIFRFFATHDCPLDNPPGEPAELVILQLAHVERLKRIDSDFEEFRSRDDLDRRVRCLRFDAEALQRCRKPASIVILKAGESSVYDLSSDETVIGRDPECTIQIDSKMVSGKHARIIRDGTRFLVEDMGSGSGTIVNGVPIRTKTPLSHEDRIKLGPILIRFIDHSVQFSPRPLSGSDDSSNYAAFTAAPPPAAVQLNLTDEEEDTATIIGSRNAPGGDAALLDALNTNSAANQQGIGQVNRPITDIGAFHRLLPNLLDSLLSIFPNADRGAILLNDSGTGTITRTAVRCRRPGEDDSVRISRTILNQVLSEKRGILAVDAGSDDRFKVGEPIANFAIRSTMWVPLLGKDGQPLGAITLDTQNPLKQFQVDDLDLLMSVVRQAAHAFAGDPHTTAPASKELCPSATPDAHGSTRETKPLLEPIATEPAAKPFLDENVQFTTYCPQQVLPSRFYTVLAFAHLDRLPPDADQDEPDPVQRVRDQAREILGDKIESYRATTQESLVAVPREGELTFVLEIAGFHCNPPRQTVFWEEPLHRVEFRIRADSTLDCQTCRGRLTIFLGDILLADVALRIEVTRTAPDAKMPPRQRLTARPYRKVFASYSRKDLAVVEQFERYARALGDRYLRDLVDLRSGDEWNDGLKRLIDEADVFQLFWSSNSMRSECVREEWEYALALGRSHFVRPFHWELPFPEIPPDLPPPELRKLHFNLLGRFVIWTDEPAVDVSQPISAVVDEPPAFRFSSTLAEDSADAQLTMSTTQYATWDARSREDDTTWRSRTPARTMTRIHRLVWASVGCLSILVVLAWVFYLIFGPSRAN